MLNVRHIVGAVLLFVSGLVKLIGECKDFYELEKGIQRLTSKVCSQIFVWALEQIDMRLMSERDKDEWEVVGFRIKTIASAFGEVAVKRRLYRNRKTGETKFFLDELFGLPKFKRITPCLRELAISLSTEVSYRRAAEIIGFFVPGVSPMTVWQATQEAGEILQGEGREKRVKVFERGEDPGGKEVTSELFIEADEVVIRLQKTKEKERFGAIKHVVAYEEKKAVAPGRFALKNKLVLSSLAGGEEAWEETCALIGEKWDLNQVEKIYVGGDGGEWPKQGTEYFPGAEYRLDPYHLNKRLTEALLNNEEAFQEAAQAISKGSWEETEKALLKATGKLKGNRKKKVIKLLGYLKENWEGIQRSPETERLGTIEGQVQHNVARRMKRLGARWTISGGDHMARVLAAKADGRLKSYTKRWPLAHAKLADIVLRPESREKQPEKEDLEGWLRASIPALKGPFASHPWVKYVLKELSRPSFSAVLCG